MTSREAGLRRTWQEAGWQEGCRARLHGCGGGTWALRGGSLTSVWPPPFRSWFGLVTAARGPGGAPSPSQRAGLWAGLLRSPDSSRGAQAMWAPQDVHRQTGTAESGQRKGVPATQPCEPTRGGGGVGVLRARPVRGRRWIGVVVRRCPGNGAGSHHVSGLLYTYPLPASRGQ